MTPPRAFLFDIGNVLLRFDFTLALRALAVKSAEHDPVQVLALLEPIKFALEDGQIDRAAFIRGVLDVLRFTGTEDEFIAAWEDIFEENAPMIALVEKLQGSFPLYLLSNTSDIHVDYIFRRYPVFQRFDAGIYSYAVHASKPGPEIYRIAIETLGIDPADTFFIDDLLPNIETARALGFRAHHYHHERHDALLADLAANGVNVNA
jgi:glucose-1-phosphatase